MVVGQFSQWSSGLHVNFCRADRSCVDVDQLKTPVKMRNVQIGLSGPVVVRPVLLGFQLSQRFHVFPGAARPLDFGHWSAHKLEQLSDFQILHGEAVAMGIALDSIYSTLSGRLHSQKAKRIIQLLINLGFEITHPWMQIKDDNSEILQGLHEFREHLGGLLTIMLLTDIGHGEEVHEMDISLLKEASIRLQDVNNKAFK